MDIHQVDVYRNNIFHLEACGLDDTFDIFKRCASLGDEATGRKLAAVIGSLQTRNIKCVGYDNPVAIGRPCRAFSLVDGTALSEAV